MHSDLKRKRITMAEYDYLIVGAGIYGASAARLLADEGKRVLVLERRSQVGGNCRTDYRDGIYIHSCGAHIFHTDNEDVWKFVNRFADFNGYRHTVRANYKGELYSLPFSMYTFNEMWGVKTAEQAMSIINAQREAEHISGEPVSLEEQAVSMVGRDIFEKLIKSYTEKQWGRSCSELPAFIIKRLPLRMKWDDSYFDDKYQGIPEDGYTDMISRMLKGIEFRLDTDFLSDREEYEKLAEKIIFTGQVDELMGYRYGPLEYRSLRFEEEMLDTEDYQGLPVINYTGDEVPWTRIIEHRHFDDGCRAGHTIISREYSVGWKPGDEPYYPIGDEKNLRLYDRYCDALDDRYIPGGRLGEYRYYDMDDAVKAAMDLVERLTYEE